MTSPSLTPEHDAVVASAARAARGFAQQPPEDRARSLVAVADALEAAAPDLLPIAMRETGLSEARLSGEIARAAVQLRMFADVVVDGAYLDARIDEADTEFALGVRPDLRRTHLPLGPIINFAASNFPFAFSVAGGDTAAALAAGCPVIVKAHSGHPDLSDATAAVVSTALRETGQDAGVFQLIHGQEAGVAVLKDPRIAGGSFTGSIYAGRLLADIAATRPTPIPFFGELGSVNPVFVTRAAIAERADELVSGFITSVAGSAGQLCTKPGFLFVPEQHGLDDALATAAAPVPEHRMLGPRIAQSYAGRRADILAVPGVRIIAEGAVRIDEEGQGWVTPTIVSLSTATLRAHHDVLRDEVFGPMSLVIEVPEDETYLGIMPEFFEGNLTGTLHLSAEEKTGDTGNVAELRELVEELTAQAGRVLFDGWPTGVAVTHAQTHGGPWPATTNNSSTSVGSAAIERFQRPISYQNAPEAFLPAELRDTQARQAPVRHAPAGESTAWGARWR